MSRNDSSPDPSPEPADTAVRRYRPASADAIALADLIESKQKKEEQDARAAQSAGIETDTVPEIGGRRKGLDPTRFGDWEKDGRCIDF